MAGLGVQLYVVVANISFSFLTLTQSFFFLSLLSLQGGGEQTTRTSSIAFPGDVQKDRWKHTDNNSKHVFVLFLLKISYFLFCYCRQEKTLMDSPVELENWSLFDHFAKFSHFTPLLQRWNLLERKRLFIQSDSIQLVIAEAVATVTLLWLFMRRRFSFSFPFF